MLLVPPTETFPNATVEGVAVSLGVPAATPVPLIGIERVAGDPLLTTDTEPVATPTLVGVKVNVAEADCDGFSVKGVVIGEEAKAVPDTETWLTIIAELDELVTVIVCVAVVPTVTCPKSIDVGLLPRDPLLPPLVEPLELAVTPPHPQSAISVKQISAPASFSSLSTGSSRQKLSCQNRASTFTKGAGKKNLQQLTRVHGRLVEVHWPFRFPVEYQNGIGVEPVKWQSRQDNPVWNSLQQSTIYIATLR
jgi:hypothetical protein